MKKKSYLRIFMVPMCLIVLLQGLLPFLTLIVGGVRTRLEQSVIGMDEHIVENQKTVLENDMVEKWRSVSQNSNGLSAELSALLSGAGTDVNGFLASEELQQEYLENVFEDLTNALQYNYTTGIFLILANDSDISEPADYRGFFLRDSDPESSTYSNTDLLLERGSKKLGEERSIALDSSWSVNFHLMGLNGRESDAFFYEPYTTALAYPDADMSSLGYWSKPFILEDHTMDSHEMISYSIPLSFDGTVYGVLGVEISLGYLAEYLSVSDLDDDLNAGYALAVSQGDGKYTGIAGKGVLSETVFGEENSFSLEEDDESAIQKVRDHADVCAFVSAMDIYSNNAPYDDTEWALVGFVTGESVYGLGRQIYRWMLIAIFSGLVLAMILVFILTKRSVAPVYRLKKSVQGGVAGIKKLLPSGIAEVDSLHEVIETLTDSQARNEAQLLEEKERYRIAVESSDDMFFTYRRDENRLEVVNSYSHDGIWDCSETPFLTDKYVFPEDQGIVAAAIASTSGKIDVEFRMKKAEGEEYEWVKLTGTVFSGKDGNGARIVGCIHNIHRRKMLEQEKENRIYMDDVTGFYRLNPGVRTLKRSERTHPAGILAVLDIAGFMHISKRYGLLFGDVLLERLAALLVRSLRAKAEIAEENAVYVRAGTDQFLVWLPEAALADVQGVLENVQKEFAQFVGDEYLSLKLFCALVETEELHSVDIALNQVHAALYAAKRSGKGMAVYGNLSETEQLRYDHVAFRQTTSMGRLSGLTLSSLALNLLDRSEEVPASLAVLALKLEERYGLTDFVITRFDREELSNTLTYRWKKNGEDPTVVRCTELEYQKFLQEFSFQELEEIAGRAEETELLRTFAAGEDGLMFHMMDNGGYSGSLLFFGADTAILDREDRKQFHEIASIIQNRVNLKRHDQSAQAKADFLARMSHEIRTPMNGIIGMAGIALKDGQTEERRIDCLKKIENSSHYLLGLINDILDMSKIESGKLTLVSAPFGLRELLRSLETLMEPRFREKRQEYVQEVEVKHNGFMGDELRISQILVNLLSNASKYTPEGGHIRFVVRETEAAGASELFFAVTDDGIGIAKEKQQLIFRRFEQADDSRNARIQGTGLGLSISNRLIHMMNSEISLQSAPGKGSTFSFSLRLNRAEYAAVPEEDEEADFTGKRLLIVEDNELNTEIICSILQECGAVTEEACNGEEAVRRVSEAPPAYYDAVLMDIRMPVMDGLAATRAIRGSGRADLDTLPIIAMSANAFDDDVKRSLASGMNAHLSKPVNVRMLKKTLKKFVR